MQHDGMGEKFKTYLGLQVSWWVGSWGLIFWLSPTARIMQTHYGRAVISTAGQWLRRVWPSRHASIQSLGERIYTSPNGRTTGEFLLLNKLLSPVVFPALVGTANTIVNRRHANDAMGFASGASEEPDLVSSDQPVQALVRKLSVQLRDGRQNVGAGSGR